MEVEAEARRLPVQVGERLFQLETNYRSTHHNHRQLSQHQVHFCRFQRGFRPLEALIMGFRPHLNPHSPLTGPSLAVDFSQIREIIR